MLLIFPHIFPPQDPCDEVRVVGSRLAREHEAGAEFWESPPPVQVLFRVSSLYKKIQPHIFCAKIFELFGLGKIGLKDCKVLLCLRMEFCFDQRNSHYLPRQKKLEMSLHFKKNPVDFCFMSCSKGRRRDRTLTWWRRRRNSKNVKQNQPCSAQYCELSKTKSHKISNQLNQIKSQEGKRKFKTPPPLYDPQTFYVWWWLILFTEIHLIVDDLESQFR